MALNLRLITLYLALHVLVDTLAVYLYVSHRVGNNLFIYHFFTPIEYGVISSVFFTSIQQKAVKKLIIVSVPVLLLFSVFSAQWLTGLRLHNSYPVGLKSLLVITWSLLLLRELFMMQQETSASRLPMFWVSTGFLFYHAGTVLVETSINYIKTYSRTLANSLYDSVYFFDYLLLIMICFGLYRTAVYRRSPTIPQ